MHGPRRIYVIEDPRYREHRGPAGHPECPERLLAVSHALADFEPHLERGVPRLAEPDEILRVHGSEMLRHVEQAARQGPGRLDPDTFVSPESFQVARLAAGGTVEAARAVVQGRASAALAAVRPPGHHAEAGRAMGFCLFNNVAIAARALQAEDGVDKLMILDWDVHHGNGTQHTFDEDPSILYVSTHQFPYYPGTGAAIEVGLGAGAGTTLNIPMPAGCGDDEYLGALLRVVVPAAQGFRPDAILISCGFDAHAQDPLASMEVSGSGYLAMTRIVRGLAEDLCGGRMIFVLEGGYSPLGLDEGIRAVLQGLLDPTAVAPPSPDAPTGSLLRGILERVAPLQQRFHQGIFSS